MKSEWNWNAWNAWNAKTAVIALQIRGGVWHVSSVPSVPSVPPIARQSNSIVPIKAKAEKSSSPKSESTAQIEATRTVFLQEHVRKT
jgi:hypothetical protein